jgi:CubicO group peptidase (beta-lactamase class C family)
MAHSAGLANPMPCAGFILRICRAPTLKRMTERLLRGHGRLGSSLAKKRATRIWETLVLGLAMQRASATEFTELIRREVLEPLGMLRTGFNSQRESPRATAYHLRVDPMRFLLPRWVTGAAMGRWLTLNPFLLDGKPNGGLAARSRCARFLRMHVCDGASRWQTASGAMRPSRGCGSSRRQDGALTSAMGWFRPRRRRSADPPFVEHLAVGQLSQCDAALSHAARRYRGHGKRHPIRRRCRGSTRA